MSLLLLFLLVWSLFDSVSSKEAVEDDRDEIMCKSEKLDGIEEKVKELEMKLEAKNVEVENFQKRLTEMEVQTESRVEEMLRTRNQNQNQEVASLKSEMKMEIAGIQNQLQEVKAARKNQNQEVAKSLKNEMTAAVDQGLRDLPFEIVCAYQKEWKLADSVVSYERVTVEFNNSNRPGGGDGSMDISTGVFTTVTSGYYTRVVNLFFKSLLQSLFLKV